jgi:hypothetical protein
MKVLLRVLAGLLLLIAVMAAVNDVTRSLAADRPTALSTYEHWARLAPGTLAAARAAVERRTHPVVWSWGLGPILQVPAWGLFGALGLVCGWAGRRRREVNIFAN